MNFEDIKVGDRILLPQTAIDHWNNPLYGWVREGVANANTPFFVVSKTEYIDGSCAIRYHIKANSPFTRGPTISILDDVRKYVEPRVFTRFTVVYEVYNNIYVSVFKDETHFKRWKLATGHAKILAIKEVQWTEGEGL